VFYVGWHDSGSYVTCVLFFFLPGVFGSFSSPKSKKGLKKQRIYPTSNQWQGKRLLK